MLIGYARVSTDDQHLDLQRDAKAARPDLIALFTNLRVGDDEG